VDPAGIDPWIRIRFRQRTSRWMITRLLLRDAATYLPVRTHSRYHYEIFNGLPIKMDRKGPLETLGEDVRPSLAHRNNNRRRRLIIYPHETPRPLSCQQTFQDSRPTGNIHTPLPEMRAMVTAATLRPSIIWLSSSPSLPIFESIRLSICPQPVVAHTMFQVRTMKNMPIRIPSSQIVFH